MKLDEYLFKNKMSVVAFAKKLSMTTQTMRSANSGFGISFKTARKIVAETGEKVGYEEIMPEQYITMIGEYLRKNK